MAPRFGATAGAAFATALALCVAGAAHAQRERPPAGARVLRALEGRLPAPIFPVGGVVAAGGGRAVAVVASPHGSFRGECSHGEWDLHAAVVQAQGSDLRVLGLVELPTRALFALTCNGEFTAELGTNSPRIAAARAADLDQDGETEVSIVLEYQNAAECGSGFVLFRQLYVVDLDPSPSLAASILSREDPQAETWPQMLGTVLFEDTNGDGHDDLVLRARTCELVEMSDRERTCARPQRTVYAWSRERDGWTEVPRSETRASTPCHEGE